MPEETSPAVTVVGKECKFAIHIPTRNRDTPDVHLIKERIHFSDGTSKAHVSFVKDFKRSLYVTKKNKQNHKDKKEWESIENLNKYTCTESQLRDTAAQALGMGWTGPEHHIKKLAQSPYLYGTDITSTAIIKRAYQDKYPEAVSEYSVATYDIETDVINGTKDIIMANVCFQNKTIFCVTKTFIEGIALPEELFHRACEKYIGEYIEKRNQQIEFHIAETPAEVIRIIFARVHEWQPDFLAIWNMDFDIPKTLETLEQAGIDPKEYLCHPSIPNNLRICKYKQGPKKKVTASGKVVPINPAAQWRTLLLTSSFYVIDAMCSYKHIRLGAQEEPSYSLDAILNKILGIRKLKFKEADAFTGLRWHQFMQTNFKVEYMVYNIFDSLSMLELDAETKDLCFTLPSYSVSSDFWNFKSQPKRIVDELYFRNLKKGYIVASKESADDNKEKNKYGGGNEEEYDNDNSAADDEAGDDEDEEDANGFRKSDVTLSLTGNIVTLPAHMSVLGMRLIEEDPSICTNIRTHTYDSDMVSAYPSCISAANVSKETTHRELINVEGIHESIFRMQNLNMILGAPNAIEYSTTMFGMPEPDDLLAMFLSDMN